MEASNGKVRADVAHDKLVALGYAGSERTTRRAVAAARSGVAGRAPPGAPALGARARPVVPVGLRRRPGGRRGRHAAVLRLAGLEPVPGGASRSGTRSLPTVIACIDTTLRRFGGCPTYGLAAHRRRTQALHGDEVVDEERLDQRPEGLVRRVIGVPPTTPVGRRPRTAVGLGEELGCDRQVDGGGDGVDVAHERRQPVEPAGRVDAFPIPAQQAPHGEGVAQRVQPWRGDAVGDREGRARRRVGGTSGSALPG